MALDKWLLNGPIEDRHYNSEDRKELKELRS